MKWRTKWWVGRHWWRNDYDTQEKAMERASLISLRGFHHTSKAGVITFYPSHRISGITVRQVRVAVGGGQ
jgi:hypothetical protein